MLLIKNAHVLAPTPLGQQDILLAAGKVVAMEKSLDAFSGVEVWDAQGKWLTPGCIDQHIHLIGAGGKRGFMSMTPEVTLTELVRVGTTTAVGLMGTDGSTRSIKSLYAKVKALEMEGLSAYMYSGYYGLDPVHIMDNMQEEMIFIDKVLGCKIAIADVRSSYPTDLELLRVLRQIRVGGMIAGKKGILHIHLGNLKTQLDPLFRIVEEHQFPIQHISPTHVGRSQGLFDEALRFAKLGGMIDITTGASKYTDPYKSVLYALDQGVPLERLTFSSDGNAGLDKLDENGNFIGVRRAPFSENLNEVIALSKSGGLDFSEAIKLITQNPAHNLGLAHKGKVAVGADADFCCFDEDLHLLDVFAHGKQLLKDGSLTIKDTFA
jgi:beta-aspartyl-dipeptidase (metallo-type)